MIEFREYRGVFGRKRTEFITSSIFIALGALLGDVEASPQPLGVILILLRDRIGAALVVVESRQDGALGAAGPRGGLFGRGLASGCGRRRERGLGGAQEWRDGELAASDGELSTHDGCAQTPCAKHDGMRLRKASRGVEGRDVVVVLEVD